MSTRYSNFLVTALWLSMPLALNAHAAEPALQLGTGLSTMAQGASGQGFGLSGFQVHSGTALPTHQAGGVLSLSSNTQLAAGPAPRATPLPGGNAGRPGDVAQTPNTEAEHSMLILAALLMVGMVVSRRLMR